MPEAVKIVGDVKLAMELEIDGKRTDVIKDFLAVDYGTTRSLLLMWAPRSSWC